MIVYGVRIPSIKSTYMEHLYEMLDTFTALLELGATPIKSSSLMDKIFDLREDLNFSPHKLSFIGGGLVEGGSETPACMILTFIGAMTKWPSIQKRAQAEIDAIIGERSFTDLG